MSKSCWERGEIKLPSDQAVSFRHSLVTFYNQRQDKMYADALALYTRLKATGKGKRNFDFDAAFGQIACPQSYGISHPVEGYDEIYNVLFPYEKNEKQMWNRVRKPKAPKKSSFKHLKLSTKNIPVNDESGITFKGSTVIWSVSENNHAVERAHENPMGRQFFKQLSLVKWTTRSGGTIIGNDEYNEDSGREYAGGGGSYVTNRYGKDDKQFKQSLGAVASWRRF
jgi:hypothetical protein